MPGGRKKVQPKFVNCVKNVMYFGAVLVGAMAFGVNGVSASTVSLSGGTNITATVVPTPPNDQATIDQPKDGDRFTTTPLVVRGTCGAGLVVRILDNDVLVGTTTCSSLGNYTVNITLQFGPNKLRGLNYDTFGQQGPDSPLVTVYVDSTPTNQPIPVVSDHLAAESDPNKPRPIFSNTPLAPAARFLGVNSQISPRAQAVVAGVVNVSFSAVVLALILFIFIL